MTGWRRFRCRYCSLVYDEELGLPEDGLASGTRWEDIPDEWYCPQCGTEKSDFDLIED